MKSDHYTQDSYKPQSPIISGIESAVANAALVQIVTAAFLAAFDIVFMRQRLPFRKVLALYMRDPITWCSAGAIGTLQGLATYRSLKKSNQAHRQLESRNEALELALSMTGSSLHEVRSERDQGRQGVSHVDRLMTTSGAKPDVNIR